MTDKPILELCAELEEKANEAKKSDSRYLLGVKPNLIMNLTSALKKAEAEIVEKKELITTMVTSHNAIAEQSLGWERRCKLLEDNLKEAVSALEFYEDRENWDDDAFNPTCWVDGNIDLGQTARAALEKIRRENK